MRLEVFNILGQRVATLVDGEQEAGAYRARWDGTDAAGGAAASGLYIYRLTVAGAQWTGKMVLVDGQAGVPLGGARVEAVSAVEGSTGRYGLVVAGEGLVAYVDSDFGAAGMEPVVFELAAGPQGAGKVVPTLEGMLGDVNTDGRVDMDDGLLVAMYRVDPALSLPNHGPIALGDVNCNGQVELEDAGLIGTFVANASDPAVSSLRIGQPGGYSLDPVTEVIWGSILGTEQQDATVAQILDEVPVLMSGIMPIDGEGRTSIDGEDRLYVGIDRAWWAKHGGKHIYAALKARFPVTPIHVEPTIGIVRPPPIARRRPPAPPASNPPPMRLTGPSLSFTESPRSTIEDHTQQQRVVGQITVPEDVTVGAVSVGVEIIHPSRGDLKIDLVAPSGVATTLYDGVEAGINPQANLIDVLPATTELQGQAAQGVWQLRVGDYGRADAGRLQTWELTIIPTSAAQETADSPHLFLETFQQGLNAWNTTSWEARSHDDEVPGEGPGNIVAQAKGCVFCFLTLKTPLDLSAHETVTLSFYRWIGAGLDNNEFLGVEVGNGGSYQRLKTWNKSHADGQWHRETFTLSGDQIGDATTIRFFAIATNSFSTFAIDNILITATPGTIVVEPEEPTEGPDLAITTITATPTTVQPGNRTTLRATIKNTDAPEETRIVTFYRHTNQTETPRTGGRRIGTRSTILPTNASRTVSGRTRTPTTPGTYHYYACVTPVQGEQDTTNNCSKTPATVTVQVEEIETPPVEEPEVPEEETPEPEQDPTTKPDLVVTDTVSLPLATTQSGDTVTIQTTVTNSGTAPAGTTIRVYRHTRETSNPRQGGTRETNTATTGTLAPAATVSVTSTHRAPTVSAPTHYYYYVCVDTVPNEQNTNNNCSPNPATVIVRVKPEDPGPPYRTCYRVPERSTPMGGDRMFTQPIGRDFIAQCGTITLGGLETTDGTRGFVASAHVIAHSTAPFDYTNTDIPVGYRKDENYKLQHLLGTVFRMPTLYTEGTTQTISVDAAFVAYPHPKTPGCSLTWSGDGEEFCLSVGASDTYIDRLVPLTVRGANGASHTVVGSKEPTADLAVQAFGSVSGVPIKGTTTGHRMLTQNITDKNYAYNYVTVGDSGRAGDSGSPVYTTPDAAGNVHIVGIAVGLARGGITFDAWSDIAEEFDLKPIGE